MKDERLPDGYVLRQTASGLWEWGRWLPWRRGHVGSVEWSDRRVPTVSRAIRLAREDQYARDRAA